MGRDGRKGGVVKKGKVREENKAKSSEEEGREG